jgi:hypothetical protein
VWTAPSQIGVAPEQSASVTQATQVSVDVSHLGVAPVHALALVAVQATQSPAGEQAGPPLAPAAHCASVAQGTHVMLVQIG